MCFFSWTPLWFWIMPLLMLGMVVLCMLVMRRGRCGGGGCCGEHGSISHPGKPG